MHGELLTIALGRKISSTLLDSSGWPTNYIDMNQIKRRKSNKS